MLIVIILIIAILFVIGCVLTAKDSDVGFALLIITLVLGAVAGIAFISLISTYPYNVDQKLEMYQEENLEIETKVKDTVRVYMDYEEDVYKNLIEAADLTTLLIKYPELNSNELIKTEIETYKENSKQIKDLKSKQIDRGLMAWWLWFGK